MELKERNFKMLEIKINKTKLYNLIKEKCNYTMPIMKNTNYQKISKNFHRLTFNINKYDYVICTYGNCYGFLLYLEEYIYQGEKFDNEEEYKKYSRTIGLKKEELIKFNILKEK